VSKPGGGGGGGGGGGVGDVARAARHLFYAMCLLDWRDGTAEDVGGRRVEAIRHLEQSIAADPTLQNRSAYVPLTVLVDPHS